MWRLYQSLTKKSNYKSAHHSCHPVDDHHDVEDDDQGCGRWPPYPACSWIDRPCNRMPCATCSLIGLSCCVMICVWIFVPLELLPLALSDLKIGSNSWVELVSSLGCSLFFTSRNFRSAARKSARDRLAVETYRPHHFRIGLVVAEWQRMSGLLLRICLSACKTLQTIRCSSANIGQFTRLTAMKN